MTRCLGWRDDDSAHRGQYSASLQTAPPAGDCRTVRTTGGGGGAGTATVLGLLGGVAWGRARRARATHGRPPPPRGALAATQDLKKTSTFAKRRRSQRRSWPSLPGVVTSSGRSRWSSS